MMLAAASDSCRVLLSQPLQRLDGGEQMRACINGVPAILHDLQQLAHIPRGGPQRTLVHSDAAHAHSLQLTGNHDLPAIHGGVGGHGDQPAVLQHHQRAPRHQRWAEAAHKQGRQ